MLSLPSAPLAISGLWLALVVWLILRAFGQRHALKPLVHAGPAAPPGVPATEAPRVAIIVPARDEGVNIGPCLDSLLAQRYPSDRWRILVVDDGSTDDTGALVTARSCARLTLITAPPLPPGWKGKVHACAIGAQAAPEADRLCFIDADMRAHPDLLASAVAVAEAGVEAGAEAGTTKAGTTMAGAETGATDAGAIGLLSLAPRHESLGSFAERLILPCGLYLLGFSQDLERIQAPGSGEAVATGQFMLIGREAYADVGGFAAVRDEICEDVALARLIKERGHRVLLLDGSALLATRMYRGWSTLWPGIAKNLTHMLGGTGRTLAAALTAVALAWASVLVPAFDAVRYAHGVPGSGLALALALAGTGAALGLHLAGAVHFHIPLYHGLLYPLGYTVGAVLAVDSVRWTLTGRVRWKGRVYS